MKVYTRPLAGELESERDIWSSAHLCYYLWMRALTSKWVYARSLADELFLKIPFHILPFLRIHHNGWSGSPLFKKSRPGQVDDPKLELLHFVGKCVCMYASQTVMHINNAKFYHIQTLCIVFLQQPNRQHIFFLGNYLRGNSSAFCNHLCMWGHHTGEV